ncbi:MAG: radical SAM protein [Fervidicoccaceae archaeon]
MRGSELSVGCELCREGLKIPIFITGLCEYKCYYCPISRARRRDVVFAGDKKVRSIEELVLEVARVDARGAGITGGEPLYRFDRTLRVVEALKDLFGDRFHIHLYTNGRLATAEVLRALERAGLDEIRFHPVEPGLERRAILAKKLTSMDVGFEVPAIPGRERQILELARLLHEAGGGFINLNELEAAEPNIFALSALGLEPDESGVAVRGSREAALSVIREIAELGLRISIHFCSASFKTSVQDKLRYARALRADLQVYERALSDYEVAWYEVELSDDCEVKELIEKGLVFRSESSGKLLSASLEHVPAKCVKRAKMLRGLPTHPRTVLEEVHVTYSGEI